MSKCLLILLSLYVFCLTSNASVPSHQPLYGIIIPTTYEIDYLQQAIQHPKILHIDGLTYMTGSVHGKNIIFVISGLGKINAAVIASRLIKDFHPDWVLLSGSSGNINPHLHIGDVIIGQNVIDVDFGQYTNKGIAFPDAQYLMNPQVNHLLPLVFKLDEHTLSWIKAWQKKLTSPVKLGVIATSDYLPNPLQQLNLLKINKIDVIEMEGAAMMHTCWLFNTPCLVIRGVSNNAYTNITNKGMKLAADNAAKITLDLVQHLPI